MYKHKFYIKIYTCNQGSDNMDFLYTISHNYVKIAAVSILSLIMNNSNKPLNIHIITLDFTDDDYSLLNDITRDFSFVSLNFYDLQSLNIEKYNIPPWRGNQIANARLFFSDVLDIGHISKLLYLDGDTIVNANLDSLFKYRGAVNAVLEPMPNYRLEKLKLDKYFNSGVLLFDVEKWLEGEFEERLIEYREKNPEEELLYPDQDLLNLAIGLNIDHLPLRYNIPPIALISNKGLNHSLYHNSKRYNLNTEYEKEIENAAIYHCYGLVDIKPWTENAVNPLNSLFLSYMDKIDPEFEKEKLKGLRNVLAKHPNIFYRFYRKYLDTNPELVKGFIKMNAKRKTRSL